VAPDLPKAPLRGAHIDYALEHLDTGDEVWDLRAKALLATAYCTMARRAELVALQVADISFAKTGDGVAQPQRVLKSAVA
jgi:site-specific recombinase XerD